ncbi:MAG: SIS domain-containing protein [Candidatus Nanopelagicales bacterium]
MNTLMREEILSQPAAILNTIEQVRSLQPKLTKIFVDNQISNIVFFARGTSDNAAIYGFYLFANKCGIHATSGHPSLATSYKAAVSLKNTLAIGISQSGKTEEIIEALNWAKRSGAATLGLTNTPDSPIFAAADLTILTQAGEERAVPATKTFTSALVALAVIAESVSPDQEFTNQLNQLPEQIQLTLNQTEAIEKAAKELVSQDTAVITGRGYSVSIANEIALKFQESCYLKSLGMSAADLQHGPKAVVDHTLPIIAFVPGRKSPVNNTVIELVSRLKPLAASVIAVGPTDCGLPADIQIELPETQEALLPILMAPPAQLMVEATAVAKGINPDLPRGLTKVTQT